MKKIRLFYESVIYKEDDKEVISFESDGYLNDSNGLELSFVFKDGNESYLNLIKIQGDTLLIKKDASSLKFSYDRIHKCDYLTAFGSLSIETKLVKLLVMDKEIFINYVLYLEGSKIGNYVVNISYEEV